MAHDVAGLRCPATGINTVPTFPDSPPTPRGEVEATLQVVAWRRFAKPPLPAPYSVRVAHHGELWIAREPRVAEPLLKWRAEQWAQIDAERRYVPINMPRIRIVSGGLPGHGRRQ